MVVIGKKAEEAKTIMICMDVTIIILKTA